MLGDFWRVSVNFKFNCNVLTPTVQGALFSGFCTFAGQTNNLQNELFPLEASQNRLARRLLAVTRRNWDSESGAPKAQNSADGNGAQKSVDYAGQKQRSKF